MITESFDPSTGQSGLGQFEVTFRAGTDIEVLGAHVDPSGTDTAGGPTQNMAHDTLVVTSGPIDNPTRTNVLAAAMFSGEMLEFDLDDSGAAPWKVSGPSILNWVGDADGKSPSIGAVADYTVASPIPAGTGLADYLAYVVAGDWLGGLTADATAASVDTSDLACAARTWDSMRTIIAQLCAVTTPSTEMWCSPDGVLYFAGLGDTTDAVYQWNPTILFASGVGETVENGLRSVPCRIRAKFDYGPEANQWHYTNSAGTGTHSSGGGNRFPNLWTGTGSGVRAKFMGASDELEDQYGHGGSSPLDTTYCRRDDITVTVSDRDLRRDLKPGDYVWVNSERLGLFDSTNPMLFDGRTLAPVRRRVSEMRWPVTPNHGVYVIRNNSAVGGANAVTDVTGFVVVDSGATSVRIQSGPPVSLRSAILGSQWRPRWDKA